MPEDLQGLLNRINEQGVQKAEEERQERLKQAREEADKIVSDANEKAEKIKEDARKDAEMLQEKGRQALQQAARDTVLSLRTRLQEIMQAVVQQTVAEDVTSEQLAEFIGKMVDAYAEQGGEITQVEALVPKEKRDEVEKYLMAQFKEKGLKQKTEINPLEDLTGGFKLSINEEDVVYDFSDEALAEALCTFLNPRLAEIVKADFSLSDDAAEKSDNDNASE